jgi:4-carboxymuconolactone decarboxylase
MIDQLYEQSPKDQMHLQRFLSAHCFGDHYTRQGLDLKLRELVTLSILIASGGLEPQVKGHIQGNLNVGNDRATLTDLITQLLPWVGYPRTLNALKCQNEAAPAPAAGGKPS